jgi:hypothetical protein
MSAEWSHDCQTTFGAGNIDLKIDGLSPDEAAPWNIFL